MTRIADTPLEEARKAIARAQAEFPDLTAFGFGVISDRSISPEQVALCLEWLSKVPKVKDVNNRYDSYGLKHDVEYWAKTYITNGAFITAAVAAGFKIKHHPPNASINIGDRRSWPLPHRPL